MRLLAKAASVLISVISASSAFASSFASTFASSSVSLTPFELREKILTQTLAVHPASTWAYDWPTAIFLYGVLTTELPEERVLPRLKIQQALDGVWTRRPSVVTSPDLAALSLPAVELATAQAAMTTTEVNIIALTKAFLETEPLNQAGVFDHVGPRNKLSPWLPPTRWFVPSSVWADSSVMYVLNGFKIAEREHDTNRSLFFQNQLLKIHELLWDSKEQLYKHAYFIESKTFAPSEGHWARGNLWMALAEFTMASELPLSNPVKGQLEAHFRDVMTSLRAQADPQSGLRTLLNSTASGNSFETTASALFAHLEMKGGQANLLWPSAERDGRALAAGLLKFAVPVDSTRTSVRGISCPTTAMVWPLYYTRVVGTCDDALYGVGAFLMMLGDLT